MFMVLLVGYPAWTGFELPRLPIACVLQIRNNPLLLPGSKEHTQPGIESKCAGNSGGNCIPFSERLDNKRFVVFKYVLISK